MEAITCDKLRVSGLKGIQEVRTIQIDEKLNEHAHASLNVILDEGSIDSFNRQCKEKTIVTIACVGINELLFAGYVEKLKVHTVAGYGVAEILLISCSVDFEGMKVKKSFQKVGSSYSTIISSIQNEVTGSIIMDLIGSKSAYQFPVIQYEETNWHFLKRIASVLGGTIISVTANPKPSVIVGIPSRQIRKNIPMKCSFGVSERYFELGGELNGLDKSSFIIQNIETYENLSIGDKLENQMIIYEKHVKTVHAEVLFYYKAGKEVVLSSKEEYNRLQDGLLLKGTVIDVLTEKIKVHLDIDASQNSSDAYTFSWAPTTGNHMYCMPEIGTGVYINLLSGDKPNAYGVSCVRENGAACGDTTDPMVKVFDNDRNVKLVMDMDSMRLSTSNGNEIINGIDMVDSILFGVKKNIQLSADYKIKTVAKETFFNSPTIIHFQKSGSDLGQLILTRTMDVKGNSVMFAASARISFEPFDDAPVEVKNNWLKLGLKLLLAAVVVVAVACVAAALIATVGPAGALIGFTAASAFSAVIGGAVLGGVFWGASCVIPEIFSDAVSGKLKSWDDYLYHFLDQFGTGAILTAPSFIPGLGGSSVLLSTALASLTYQGIDNGLDNLFGSDYYDKDGNVFTNMAIDTFCVWFGGSVTEGLKGAVGKITNKLAHLSKSDTKIVAKWLNILHRKPIYSTKQGDVNIVKHQIREWANETIKKIEVPLGINYVDLIDLLFPEDVISNVNLNKGLGKAADIFSSVVFMLSGDSKNYDENYIEDKRTYKFDKYGKVIFD